MQGRGAATHRHFGRCSAFRGCAQEGIELGILEEPCGSALEDPDCLMRLQQADVEAGFADWIPGGVEEARRLFGGQLCGRKSGLSQERKFGTRVGGGQQHQLCQ